MKTKPILFSTPMVLAILQGRKTQTRRVIKYSKKIENPKIGFSIFTDVGEFEVRGVHENGQYGSSFFKMPYQTGDIMWVRETWRDNNGMPTGYRFEYKATALEDGSPIDEPWKPSIFMPKEACRIFLKVTKVRIERLQDISNSDIVSEGAADFGCVTKKLNWQLLWEKINGKDSWNENPYVFVYDFEICDKPIDF